MGWHTNFDDCGSLMAYAGYYGDDWPTFDLGFDDDETEDEEEELDEEDEDEAELAEQQAELLEARPWNA